MKDYLFLDKQFLLPTYPRRGLTLVKGDGVYLYDQNGKKYLDMMSNYGVNILGYTNKDVNKALHQQIDTLINLHGSFANDMRSEAAKKIINLCPKHLTQLYFSSSGTEAVEAALKFARVYTKKMHFISMRHGFHGKTLGALSATENKKYQDPFKPLLWKFSHVDFGDVKQLKATLNKETAAVIIEIIQGEGGIRIPKGEYLKSVQEICYTNDVLLIVDEIQTGVGRTGSFFAFEQYGLSPDIVCLGKGLASGIPIGATIVSSKIALTITKGTHTSTFGGNPLASDGIIATIDYIQQNNLLEKVRDRGEYFLKQLKSIKSPHIKEIRGKGLMIGVELKVPVTPVLKKMQDAGVLTIPAGEMVVRFLPPYIVEKKHIDKAVNVFKEAIKVLQVTNNT